jgi:hypothetical protein
LNRASSSADGVMAIYDKTPGANFTQGAGARLTI